MTPSPLSGPGRIGSFARVWSPGALLVALAVPLLFLHVHYQPRTAFGGVDVTIADVAILAIVVAAAIEARRNGVGRLAPARPIWATGGALLLWILAATFYPLLREHGYAWRTHLVTAAKFAEYALLAPALPLLLRRRGDVVLLAGAIACWSAVATAVGFAQFLGAPIFFAGTVGRRQASFLGSHDFATLSGGAFVVGLVALAVPWLDRRIAWLALAAGLLGLIVSGSLAAAIGLALAAVALAAALAVRRSAAPRRLALLGAATLVVLAGSFAIRGADLSQFARFLGVKKSDRQTTHKVQTYAHRTLLGYLGLRIWLGHPLLGVGWQGSSEPESFRPYLAAAHRRFPREAPLAFPSASRRYGVQNLYLQTLADLGVVGFVLLAGLFAGGLLVAWRATDGAVGLVALGWLALLLGLWLAQGLVAGIPLDALTWLGFGLAGVAVARD